MMQFKLSYELQILSQAVHFKNLTGASQHIGLSQPQLSRIIKKIEECYQIQILERASKRASCWTNEAYKLSTIYLESINYFKSKIALLSDSQTPKEIKIGTLEGVRGIALKITKNIFDHTDISTVELDVYDLNSLEELFLSGDLDLIITIREPLRAKYSYLQNLGFQKLYEVNSNKLYDVFSLFEFQSMHKNKKNKATHSLSKQLISNSLSIRQLWLKEYGGRGSLPSLVQKEKPKGENTRVILLGAPTLNVKTWKILKSIVYTEKKASGINS